MANSSAPVSTSGSGLSRSSGSQTSLSSGLDTTSTDIDSRASTLEQVCNFEFVDPTTYMRTEELCTSTLRSANGDFHEHCWNPECNGAIRCIVCGECPVHSPCNDECSRDPDPEPDPSTYELCGHQFKNGSECTYKLFHDDSYECHNHCKNDWNDECDGDWCEVCRQCPTCDPCH